MTSDFCREIISQLSSYVATTLDCGLQQSGYEVITTPFLYPDRDNVDLFARELPDGRVLITDLGETMMKLASYGFTPSTSAPRRRAMIHQLIASMNVQYEEGSIVAVAPRMEVGARFWDVAMAVQRLSDLVFTVPGYTKATFSDEFEGYLAELQPRVPDRELHYRRGVQIQLPEHSFVADFVIGRKVVQLLSTGSVGYAQERVNSVYTNFAEMARASDERERLAVIDDRQRVFDSHMITLLSHQASRVLNWTRKGELERALLAA